MYATNRSWSSTACPAPGSAADASGVHQGELVDCPPPPTPDEFPTGGMNTSRADRAPCDTSSVESGARGVSAASAGTPAAAACKLTPLVRLALPCAAAA